MIDNLQLPQRVDDAAAAPAGAQPAGAWRCHTRRQLKASARRLITIPIQPRSTTGAKAAIAAIQGGQKDHRGQPPAPSAPPSQTGDRQAKRRRASRRPRTPRAASAEAGRPHGAREPRPRKPRRSRRCRCASSRPRAAPGRRVKRPSSATSAALGEFQVAIHLDGCARRRSPRIKSTPKLPAAVQLRGRAPDATIHRPLSTSSCSGASAAPGQVWAEAQRYTCAAVQADVAGRR